jgi:hypothetical protein
MGFYSVLLISKIQDSHSESSGSVTECLWRGVVLFTKLYTFGVSSYILVLIKEAVHVEVYISRCTECKGQRNSVTKGMQYSGWTCSMSRFAPRCGVGRKS